MLNASNQAWAMYYGLSHGAYEAIHAHGSEAQQQTFLPKLTSGEWTGTMCLTEPHCGTDLGLHVGVCGAGSPFPDDKRAGPCTVVVAGKRLFVFDAGSGAARNIGHALGKQAQHVIAK